MRTATKQEAINGNSNDTVITPLRLKQVLDTVDINPGEGGGSSDAPVYTAGAGISITNNVITNTITKTSQLTNDSNFITEEDILDPVPVNSIWDYEGDTVPDGFIEVEEEQVVVEETDPTVPQHVKDITIEDIEKWNSGTGGGTGSGGSLEIETIIINPKNATNEQGGKIYEVGRVQKCGNECKLILTSSAGYSIPNATYTVIGVIPEGYRPKESVVFTAFGRKTDYTTLYDFLIVINANGEISVMQRTGSSFHVGDIRGSASYFIDEPLQLPSGSSSQVYSEEETVIGTWLGKPLYRKVLTGTTVAGDTVIDLSSLNINYISKMDGTVGTNFDYRPVNFYLEGHYHSTRFAYGNLYLTSTSSYANLPFTIVLEYTKTTD